MSVLEQIRKQGEEQAELLGRKNSLLEKLKSLLSLLSEFPTISNDKIQVILLFDREVIGKVRTLLTSKSKRKITKSLMELFFQELPFETADEEKLEQMVEEYLERG